MNEPFVTVADAAHLVRRSERTIREWIRRDLVQTEHRHGTLHVSWVDVLTLDEQTARRVRLPKSHRCA